MYIVYVTDFNALHNIKDYFVNHSLYNEEQLEEFRVRLHNQLNGKELFFNDRFLLIKEESSFELPFLYLFGFQKYIFPSEEEISIFSRIQIQEISNEDYKNLICDSKYYDKQTIKCESKDLNKSNNNLIPAFAFGYFQLLLTYFDEEITYSSVMNSIKKEKIENVCKQLRTLDNISEEFNQIKKILMNLSDKILNASLNSSNYYADKYRDIRIKAKENGLEIHYDINNLIQSGVISKDKKILNYQELYLITLRNYENQLLERNRRSIIFDNEKGINWDGYLNYYPKSIHNRKQFVGWIWEYDNNGVRYQKPIDVIHSTKEQLYSASTLEEKENKEVYSWTTLKDCIEKSKKLNLDGVGIMLGYDLSTITIKNGFKNGEYTNVAKQIINKTKTFTTRQKNGDINVYGFYKANPLSNIKKCSIKGISFYIGSYSDRIYNPPCHFIAEDGFIVNDCPIVPIKIENKNNFSIEIVTDDVFSIWDTYEEINSNKNNNNDEVIKRLSNSYNLQKKKNLGMNKFDELYYNGNWYPFYNENEKIENALIDLFAIINNEINNKEKSLELLKTSALYDKLYDESLSEYENQKIIEKLINSI